MKRERHKVYTNTCNKLKQGPHTKVSWSMNIMASAFAPIHSFHPAPEKMEAQPLKRSVC